MPSPVGTLPKCLQPTPSPEVYLVGRHARSAKSHLHFQRDPVFRRLIQSTSFTLAQIIVGQIVLGLGTGAIIATVFVWQSELAKADTRGQHMPFVDLGTC